MAQELDLIEWDTWLKSMIVPNNGTYIKMPPAVANTIEPFKIHVVERYDTDMEVSLILGAFSNKEQAETYAKANGGWEYTVHEFTLDAEVPVVEEKEE